MQKEREYYYKILGLRPGAKPADIKAAYRKLVMIYHPDRDKSPDAVKMYKEIRRAYEALLKPPNPYKTGTDPVVNRTYPERTTRTSENINKRVINMTNEEKQELIIRNRKDIQYSVILTVTEVITPLYCTCCMNQTSSTETIRYSSYSPDAKRKLGINFPICSKCLQHKMEFKTLEVFHCNFAVLAGVIVLLLLPTNSELCIVYLTPLGFYLAFGMIMHTENLSPEHSTSGNSVKIGENLEFFPKSRRDHNFSVVKYTFTNWRYAKLFAFANNSRVIESKKRNSAKRQLLISAIDYPVIRGIAVMIATSLILILINKYFIS